MEEKRQGKTGVWKFMLETPEGKILACSEWGTNYEFAKKEWQDLPLVIEENKP
jgi:hypothetical protein